MVLVVWNKKKWRREETWLNGTLEGQKENCWAIGKKEEKEIWHLEFILIYQSTRSHILGRWVLFDFAKEETRRENSDPFWMSLDVF